MENKTEKFTFSEDEKVINIPSPTSSKTDVDFYEVSWKNRK